MARKTPQEKKRLSLAKDRRNTYGENSKASRKNIPRHKKDQNRVDRRAPTVALRGARGPRDPQLEDELEARAHRRRGRIAWRKQPDTPLGKVLETRRSAPKSVGSWYEDRPKKPRRAR